MEVVDFILQIDCLSHFYDWRELSVSTVTNHTWTTAALAKESEPNFPESAELCLLEQFTSLKFQTSWAGCYKRHCTEFQRGAGGKKIEEKKGHGQNRLFWNQAEYSAWINPRIQCYDLTWIWVQEVRNIRKWEHCMNNQSLYFSGPPCPDAHLQQDFIKNCTCTLLFADSWWMDIVTRGVTLIPWSLLSHFHIGFATATTKEFNWSPEKNPGISSSPMWQSIQAIQSPPSA